MDTWEVTSAAVGSGELEKLLRDGWEPFAVTALSPAGFGGAFTSSGFGATCAPRPAASPFPALVQEMQRGTGSESMTHGPGVGLSARATTRALARASVRGRLQAVAHASRSTSSGRGAARV